MSYSGVDIEELDLVPGPRSVQRLFEITGLAVDRGRSFASFAVPTILGEMRRYFRDSGWALHVPRAAKERALQVRDATASLHALHGRSPTATELAEYLELDLEQVLDALAAMEAYDTSSIAAPAAGSALVASLRLAAAAGARCAPAATCADPPSGSISD